MTGQRAVRPTDHRADHETTADQGIRSHEAYDVATAGAAGATAERIDASGEDR